MKRYIAGSRKSTDRTFEVAKQCLSELKDFISSDEPSIDYEDALADIRKLERFITLVEQDFTEI